MIETGGLTLVGLWKLESKRSCLMASGHVKKSRKSPMQT